MSAETTEVSWPQDWGRLLRLARQVAGLSLTELSARTGLSKGYLSKLESAHEAAQNPSRATLAALARALPSFRPLANTLEPGSAQASLDFGAEPAAPIPAGDAAEAPVRLGWREIELLAALVALDRAAAPVPLTSVLLARAVGRDHSETVRTLGGLVAAGVIDRARSATPRMPDAYYPSARVEDLTGLRRSGDALVLGATLLAQAPKRPRRPRGDL